MPNTYVALATVAASSSTSVTFDLTGISGYTDLEIVAQAKSSTAGSSINSYRLRFNGVSTSLYSNTFMTGNGSTATSTRDANQTEMYIGALPQASLDAQMSVIRIFNYANPNVNKTVLGRGSVASTAVNAAVGIWRSNAAITSIELFMTSATLTGTFTLYGIANADQGSAKATGGIITEDSTYWYHTFGASGAFIPKQALTCDVLVVAGGGSGGGGTGGVGSGGGGAGGYRIELAQSLTTTSYNVTVGGGGSSVNTNINGSNGSNSSFSAITATAGGGGGTYGNPDGTAGNAGGSGGGGGTSASGGSPAGGAASPSGQGSAGGAGGTGSAAPYRGGGGGGAGAVGASASASGNGGAGISTYSSWGIPTGIGQNISGTYWLAAGGGAGGNPTPGTGGSGGGGTGANTAGGNATSGLVNTGSGGGGACGVSGNSGAGGSGVVIVRYAK